jgi:hypothetical protein
LRKKYINEYKLNYARNCYNIANGGNSHKYKSDKEKEEFSLKMSENVRGENNPFYGKHHSEETKNIKIKYWF